MPFVKLDCGLLKSTLWLDTDSSRMFLTALLSAVPVVYDEPVKTYPLDSTEPTDFVVPPGWYGLVESSGPGLIHDARMPDETGMAALERLRAPDPQSRSKDFEGRRLVSVDGGFLVLNFQKYRDKDYGGAERARRYRERNRVTASRRDGRDERRDGRNRTQAEAEAEAEAEKSQKQRGEHERGIAPPALARPEDLLRTWNENRGNMLPAKSLAGDRLVKAKARLKDQPDLTVWAGAIKRASSSGFCTGSGERGWKANIDWLLRPSTLSKILEGQTDDHGKASNPGSFNLRQNAEDDANKRDWAAKDAMLARMKAANGAKRVPALVRKSTLEENRPAESRAVGPDAPEWVRRLQAKLDRGERLSTARPDAGIPEDHAFTAWQNGNDWPPGDDPTGGPP